MTLSQGMREARVAGFTALLTETRPAHSPQSGREVPFFTVCLPHSSHLLSSTAFQARMMPPVSFVYFLLPSSTLRAPACRFLLSKSEGSLARYSGPEG